MFRSFKAYDGMFVLRQLYDEGRNVTRQIGVGPKVLSLKSGDSKFVDSSCFLPQALASFPKTFGLTEMKKGVLSPNFNTKSYQVYVGLMPAKDYYGPEGMSEAKCAEFATWHDVRVAVRYLFNFREKLMAYC